jgi:hypothetical protein
LRTKLVLILVAALLAIGMFWTRYQVVGLSGVGGFYRINRLTGNTELVAGVLTQPVKGIRESQVEIMRQRELRDKAGVAGPSVVPNGTPKKP